MAGIRGVFEGLARAACLVVGVMAFAVVGVAVVVDDEQAAAAEDLLALPVVGEVVFYGGELRSAVVLRRTQFYRVTGRVPGVGIDTALFYGFAGMACEQGVRVRDAPALAGAGDDFCDKGWQSEVNAIFAVTARRSAWAAALADRDARRSTEDW